MFFFIPVGVNYSARRYPVVTFTIMGICTAVYLATLALALENGRSVYLWTSHHLWLVPEKSYWWTYLTSMFVHAGLFHLLGNMVYLFLFGSCVEDIIGRVQFVIFYLLCGLVAELAYIGMIPAHFTSEIPMGGASGAISGCMGGFMLLLLKTNIEFKWFSFFFFRPVGGEFSLQAWLVISLWFLKDLVFAILASTMHSTGGGVAFGAHVGGTLCGLGWIGLDKLRLKAMPTKREASPQTLVAESQDIFLWMDGAQLGPFTLSQIRNMLSLGSVSEGTVYWKDGMEDWRSVEELA